MRQRDFHNRSKSQHGLASVPLLILSGSLLFLAALALGAFKAQSRTPRPLRSQPIEDPDGRALLNFHRALIRTLARAKEGETAAVTRIVHYGDSHVAADLLTGALRQAFQRDFGDAGPGFLLAGRPWAWYRRSGVESGSSEGWRVDGLTQASLDEDGRLGLAGISLSTDRAGERIWMTAACQRFDLYLMKQPNGGSVDVWLDGVKYHDSVSLSSETIEPAYLTVEADDDSLHSIELRTATPGWVRIFGVAAERKEPGVSYDALGVNGARVSRPLAWDWPLLASNLARRDPDLIIVAYGSNEVSDAGLDLAEYRRNFTELLRRLHTAAPRASLLVIAPPDRAARIGRRWRTISAMPALVVAQRQAAMAAGAAFWDLYRAMGASGAINRWAMQREPLAQPDRVHLTPAGYRLVAETLYTELMRGHWATFWQLFGSTRWFYWMSY